MGCSKTLKFLVEAEEELASIWQSAPKKSTVTKPVVLIK